MVPSDACGFACVGKYEAVCTVPAGGVLTGGANCDFLCVTGFEVVGTECIACSGAPEGSLLTGNGCEWVCAGGSYYDADIGACTSCSVTCEDGYGPTPCYNSTEPCAPCVNLGLDVVYAMRGHCEPLCEPGFVANETTQVCDVCPPIPNTQIFVDGCESECSNLPLGAFATDDDCNWACVGDASINSGSALSCAGQMADPMLTAGQFEDSGLGSGTYYFLLNSQVRTGYFYRSPDGRGYLAVASIFDTNHVDDANLVGPWHRHWSTTSTFGSMDSLTTMSWKGDYYGDIVAVDGDIIIMQGNNAASSLDDLFATATDVLQVDSVFSAANLRAAFDSEFDRIGDGDPTGTCSLVISGGTMLKGSPSGAWARYRSDGQNELQCDDSNPRLCIGPNNNEQNRLSFVNALGCTTNGPNSEHYSWTGDHDDTSDYSNADFVSPNHGSTWGYNVGTLWWVFLYRVA